MLSSLSIYKGVLTRSVPSAFHKLLLSVDEEPETFLNAYGDFYRLLCDRNASNSLSYTMTEAALFDENYFTRTATADKVSEMSEDEKKAVVRDIDAILFASQITFHREKGCGMFARYRSFVWRDKGIEPIINDDKVRISDLVDYEYQRDLVVENTRAFIEGRNANNCLLYGDMGTGKSTTVKATVNEFRRYGLRIVEIPKEKLMEFPLLIDAIAQVPMKFIIFIDDLSFQRQDECYTSLKAVLEGGVAALPKNALIYATSNRRHLVKENFEDRDCNDVNRRDNMQETLSLSDRFGLAVGYYVPDKRRFLHIVEELAKAHHIDMDQEQLFLQAESFATQRATRSPRTAQQFIKSLL